MAVSPNEDPGALWAKATGFRSLAREILPGEVRTRLLGLAVHYELQAARLQGTVLANQRSDNGQAGLKNL